MRCETCNHRFTGRALYVWRGRQKVLFLDVPEGDVRPAQADAARLTADPGPIRLRSEGEVVMTLMDGSSAASSATATTTKRGQTPEERKAAQAEWAREKRAQKDGTMAKEKPAKAEKPKKEPKLPKSKAKVEKLVQEAHEHGAEDAIASAKRIVKRYDAMQGAIGRLSDVTKACGQRLKAENEKFKSTIETGVEKDDTKAAVAQLASIHTAWQELKEVELQNSTERKEAKEAKAKAVKAFDRAIAEHRQLMLPGVGLED